MGVPRPADTASGLMMRKTAVPEGKAVFLYAASGLEGADLLGLGAFGALADLELNRLVLLEGAETAALDLGVVAEKISGSISRGDRTEALLAVEPFHSSLCHI